VSSPYGGGESPSLESSLALLAPPPLLLRELIVLRTSESIIVKEKSSIYSFSAEFGLFPATYRIHRSHDGVQIRLIVATMDLIVAR
ncbi:hypothetical protein L195_g061009, partial [Trifolium pratense]